MKPSTKKIIIKSLSLLIGVPILAVIVFVLYFSYMIGLFKNHPSDEELIYQLSINKPRYEQLIKMFRADYPLEVVAPTWQSPDSQLSDHRWNEYKEIFDELDLDMGLRKWDKDSIWFLNSTRGMVTGGDSKGLIYRPENPSPLYKTLNERPHDLESGVRGYRKISDDWYITYDWHN